MRDCTIRIAKANALICCAVTPQLICVFVFAYTKSLFSHDAAHMSGLLWRYKTYSDGGLTVVWD